MNEDQTTRRAGGGETATASNRWFQHCGRYALLRAENPDAMPQQRLVGLRAIARELHAIAALEVSVTTLESRNRVFSILGSVNVSGQYQILQSDCRLMDALVYAKDISSATGIDISAPMLGLAEARAAGVEHQGCPQAPGSRQDPAAGRVEVSRYPGAPGCGRSLPAQRRRHCFSQRPLVCGARLHGAQWQSRPRLPDRGSGER